MEQINSLIIRSRTQGPLYKMVDFSIITLFILLIASAADFVHDPNFLIAIFLYLLVIFAFRRIVIDRYIFVVLLYWLLINVVSYIVNKPNYFSSNHFIAETIRLLIPYLMLKCIGLSFFKKLFNYSYVLVIISFPLYLIEQLSPSFVSSLAPYLNMFTIREQVVSGGFYVFVYMHSGWAAYIGPFLRNCGFMWEPGGYACILILMIVYYMHSNDFKLDHKLLFLTVVLLSTFSTSGYIALVIVYAFILFNNKIIIKKLSLLLPFLVVILIIGSMSFYVSNDFMKGKIDSYVETGTKTSQWEFEGKRKLWISRLGIGIVALENSIRHPLGDGSIDSSYILEKYGNVTGPSSLANVLLQWGWIGIFALIFSLYFFKIRNKSAGLSMLLPMLIVLFSNPFTMCYLIYIIFYYSLSYKHYNQSVRLKMIGR